MNELVMDRIPPGESILARMAKIKEQSEIIQDESEAIELLELQKKQNGSGKDWTPEDAQRLIELQEKVSKTKQDILGGLIMEKDRKR